MKIRLRLSMVLLVLSVLLPFSGQARFYDPSNGRFNQMDTFAGNNDDPQSLHKYLYAHANPVNGWDPSGQMSIGTLSAIAIGVWTIAEVGLAIHDAFDTASTIADPNASWSEKGMSAGGFLLGTVAPGGGYGSIGKGIYRKIFGKASHITGKAPFDDIAKRKFREEARETWELLKGKAASADGMEVHHKIPLEWDHLFDGHPNRLDNLLGVQKELHQQTVTPFWNSWRASLGGRTPTPQEVLDKVTELERQHGHLFETLP